MPENEEDDAHNGKRQQRPQQNKHDGSRDRHTAGDLVLELDESLVNVLLCLPDTICHRGHVLHVCRVLQRLPVVQVVQTPLYCVCGRLGRRERRHSFRQRAKYRQRFRDGWRRFCGLVDEDNVCHVVRHCETAQTLVNVVVCHAAGEPSGRRPEYVHVFRRELARPSGCAWRQVFAQFVRVASDALCCDGKLVRYLFRRVRLRHVCRPCWLYCVRGVLRADRAHDRPNKLTVGHTERNCSMTTQESKLKTLDPVSPADVVPWRQQLAQALRRRGKLVQDARLLNVERIPEDERTPGGPWYRVVSL